MSGVPELARSLIDDYDNGMSDSDWQDRAADVLRAVITGAGLPLPLVVDGEVYCPNCGNQEWQITDRPERWWNLNEDSTRPGTLVFRGDWEISDDGGHEHLTCIGCMHDYDVPAGVEVDYS